MSNNSGLTLDVMALIELGRRHPDELEQLKESIIDSTPAAPGGEADGPWLPCDRFDRALQVGSLVLTPQGERGRIARFDRASERALIELDHGGTRLLKLGRVELRRGRPRKQSYAAAASLN
jgi:hypothetical protein